MGNLVEARQKLDAIDQGHLLQFWDRLTEQQKRDLLKQILEINVERFHQQQKLIHHKRHETGLIEAITDFHLSGSTVWQTLGKEQISSGKVGCLLVAGGQGTRLGYEGPKGTMPVTKEGKSLFQIFSERIVTRCKKYHCTIPFAIMTSPATHQKIQDFFAKHQYFGLDPDQLFFFPQFSLPFLSHNGDLFLDRIDHIVEGPSGNGDAPLCFHESKIWQQWHNSGIESLVFVQVDNPLADPLHPELIGSLKERGADVSLQAIFRENPEEQMGVLVKENGKVVVKEYSEISPEEKRACILDGSLKHKLANISHLCFSMEFIHGLISHELPLHAAWKKADSIDEQGIPIKASQPNAWKFERFIFDVLGFSKKTEIIISPREQCYAPIKTQNDLAQISRKLLGI